MSTSNMQMMDRSDKNSVIRDDMLNFLASRNDVFFKSQQLGEPELSTEEKRQVAEEILNRGLSLFLSRFGNYIKLDHLPYFENPPDEESYEVEFYLKQLKRFHSGNSTKTQVKNRRFEAMRRLITEGEYFSMVEMRKRNPLLFDQLLGHFVSVNEHANASKMDTLVDVLLSQIDEDQLNAFKKEQLKQENKEIDWSSCDEDSNCEESSSTKKVKNNENKLWGENYSCKKRNAIGQERWRKRHAGNRTTSHCAEISQKERTLLINEFSSAMFASFLQGKDDYNYNEIDGNPEYDDIIQCDLDEEAKYFDSESPKEENTLMMAENDDEFEKFMNNIKDEAASDQLVSSMKRMNHS